MGKWVWPAKWTPEIEAELRRLWDVEKLTALMISDRLGISRDAVIGKARRLKLERRPNPITAGPEAMAQMKAKRAATRREHAEQRKRAIAHRIHEAREIAGMPKHDRSSYLPKPVARKTYHPQHPPAIAFKACQWIEGEPSYDDACKCGKPTHAGAYCAEHAALAWAPRHPKTAAPVAA